MVVGSFRRKGICFLVCVLPLEGSLYSTSPVWMSAVSLSPELSSCSQGKLSRLLLPQCNGFPSATFPHDGLSFSSVQLLECTTAGSSHQLAAFSGMPLEGFFSGGLWQDTSLGRAFQRTLEDRFLSSSRKGISGKLCGMASQGLLSLLVRLSHVLSSKIRTSAQCVRRVVSFLGVSISTLPT